jgi:hypothetical protein
MKQVRWSNHALERVQERVALDAQDAVDVITNRILEADYENGWSRVPPRWLFTYQKVPKGIDIRFVTIRFEHGQRGVACVRTSKTSLVVVTFIIEDVRSQFLTESKHDIAKRTRHAADRKLR